MERLARVAGAGENAAASRQVRYRPGMAAYFGLGLVGGGATGAVFLAMLPMLTLSEPRGPQVPPAIAALTPWVSEAQPLAPATYPREVQRATPVDTFDVAISRTMREGAPFGFRLVGSDSTAGMEVLLRNLPPAVLPSRGERRDPATWALAAADLESLRLMLPEGAPDMFDIGIDVLAPSGTVAANSIARVRVVDPAHTERAEAPPLFETVQVETTPAELPPPRKRVAGVAPPSDARAHAPARHASGTSAREKTPPRAPPPPAPAPAAAPPAETPIATVEGRHWPEGASGLGVITRPSDRQVWWKLPMPSWSPFEDTAAPR